MEEENFNNQEEKETPKEIDENMKQYIYDLYKEGTTVREIARQLNIDTGIASKIIKDKEKEEKKKIREKTPGRPPIIDPAVAVYSKVTSELASKTTVDALKETNEAYSLGKKFIDEVKELAKARHMTPEDFVRHLIEFYKMWSPLVEYIKGTAFENMAREAIKAEAMKIINNLREILAKDPNAIKVVKYEEET